MLPSLCPGPVGAFPTFDAGGMLLGQNINKLSSKKMWLSLAFCSRKAIRTWARGRFSLHWMDGWIEILLEPLSSSYGFFSNMVSHGLSLLEVGFYINVFFKDLTINQDFFFF